MENLTFDNIVLILTSIVTVASAITAVTPTPRDDNVLAYVVKVLRALALNVGNARPGE